MTGRAEQSGASCPALPLARHAAREPGNENCIRSSLGSVHIPLADWDRDVVLAGGESTTRFPRLRGQGLPGSVSPVGKNALLGRFLPKLGAGWLRAGRHPFQIPVPVPHGIGAASGVESRHAMRGRPSSTSLPMPSLRGGRNESRLDTSRIISASRSSARPRRHFHHPIDNAADALPGIAHGSGLSSSVAKPVPCQESGRATVGSQNHRLPVFVENERREDRWTTIVPSEDNR